MHISDYRTRELRSLYIYEYMQYSSKIHVQSNKFLYTKLDMRFRSFSYTTLFVDSSGGFVGPQKGETRYKKKEKNDYDVNNGDILVLCDDYEEYLY